ncbi:hypothetical protein RAE21_12145 [Rhodoferax sp. TBRC 17198]|uniref:hypothetical protein n=1 Tax=Rhodoferax potami TaxID=3068338 RepID=UPI0028BEE101|nr:hypothetical protein [Rhodoferax sp. TBRC 17198]MDT7523151.1 hypothetical protein [Rhodoferax sp. TBRC 17198]
MSITSAIDSVGTVRNVGLKNDLLVIELAKSFIDCLEFMQGELLGKMNNDRQQTDALKERLKLQQNLARLVTDPGSDEPKYSGVWTFDSSSVSPFPDMKQTDLSIYSNSSKGPVFNGMSSYDLKTAGMKYWATTDGKNTLSSKQVFTYLDQQAEYTKSAITALNSLTSQDNLTLQSLRSKIESVTQFLSTLMKSSYDVGAGVLRNFPG